MIGYKIACILGLVVIAWLSISFLWMVCDPDYMTREFWKDRKERKKIAQQIRRDLTDVTTRKNRNDHD